MLLSYVSYALAMVSLVGASPLSSQDSERPEVLRGIIENLTITAENTINGTVPPENPRVQSHPLKLTFQNNHQTQGQMYAYILGKDMGNSVVMLDTSGQFYYPNPDGSTLPVLIPDDANVALPVNSGPNDFVIPDYMQSARIYLSDGALRFFVELNDKGLVVFVMPNPEDATDAAANLHFTFMEFTYLAGSGMNANLSFVDWVSLVTGLRLTLDHGEVQTARGLEPDALSAICAGLKEQAQDGQPWDDLCAADGDGQLIRIRSPGIYISNHPGAMADYYTAYVDEVYAKYAHEDLTVNTQHDSFGLVSCRVTDTGDELRCQDDSIPFHKPSTKDIFGCDSGPFANVGDELHKRILVRFCAAFHRSELLLPGGNVIPSLGNDSWYTVNPTNHYSRLVHLHELDGKGYAFPYDDVHPPNSADTAGSVTGVDPVLLEVFIGGGI